METVPTPLFGEQFGAVTTENSHRQSEVMKAGDDVGESEFHLCTPLSLSPPKKEGKDEVEKFMKAQHREIDWS